MSETPDVYGVSNAIIEALWGDGELDFGELVEKASCNARFELTRAQMGEALTLLEASGQVRRLPGQRYKLREGEAL